MSMDVPQSSLYRDKKDIIVSCFFHDYISVSLPIDLPIHGVSTNIQYLSCNYLQNFSYPQILRFWDVQYERQDS